MADIENALNDRPIVTNVGNGKFGLALRSEYAQAAANVLSNAKQEVNRCYELTANQINYEHFVTILSHVLGKEVQLVKFNDNEMGQVRSWYGRTSGQTNG